MPMARTSHLVQPCGRGLGASKILISDEARRDFVKVGVLGLGGFGFGEDGRRKATF